SGLSLDNGRHDQGFIGCVVRQCSGAMFPLGLEYLSHALVSVSQDLPITVASYVTIGVGEKPTFRMVVGKLKAGDKTVQCFRSTQDNPDFLLSLKRFESLAEGPAFHQGHLVGNYIALLQPVEQTPRRISQGQKIFTSMNRRPLGQSRI